MFGISPTQQFGVTYVWGIPNICLGYHTPNWVGDQLRDSLNKIALLEICKQARSLFIQTLCTEPLERTMKQVTFGTGHMAAIEGLIIHTWALLLL